jgi:hypothetical protein
MIRAAGVEGLELAFVLLEDYVGKELNVYVV